MTKECIDEFLAKNESIIQDIKRVAKNYFITDFIKSEKVIQEYFESGILPDNKRISGCIYNIREGYFRLDIESVERRLTIEYMEFLHDIMMRGEIDKVFYIVAYFYLTLCKQLGYQLTVANNAPFPFLGKEMSPLAKKNYESFNKIREDRLYGIVRHFYVKDLEYYNNCYWECGYHHHACKHFSLLQELTGIEVVVNRNEFCYEFECLLKLFIFEYRAIYTTEHLYLYMDHEVKDRIKRSCELNI